MRDVEENYAISSSRKLKTLFTTKVIRNIVGIFKSQWMIGTDLTLGE